MVQKTANWKSWVDPPATETENLHDLTTLTPTPLAGLATYAAATPPSASPAQGQGFRYTRKILRLWLGGKMAGRKLGAAGAKEHARAYSCMWPSTRPILGAKIDGKTLCLLYMVLFMTLWMSSLRWPSPAGAVVGPRRYGPAVEALATGLFFTFVTVLLQALLAIALSEKPAPTALPPAVSQWMMGISVWMSGVLFYLIYASMARGYAAEPSYSELIIPGVASVVSLAMTVYNMLQRPVFA